MSEQPAWDEEGPKLPVIWAALPLVSIGFLSWGPFLYAAIRTRSLKYRVITTLYLALTVVMGVLIATSGDHTPSGTIGGLLIFLLAGGGSVHTLAMRSDYQELMLAAENPTLKQAERRANQRQRALKLAADDPKRALELGIGRPDVPGSFDAGLIDVNHAGEPVLQRLPGIDAERAARIEELRTNGSGFTSAEELGMVLDLDPGELTELARTAVFLPRY